MNFIHLYWWEMYIDCYHIKKWLVDSLLRSFHIVWHGFWWAAAKIKREKEQHAQHIKCGWEAKTVEWIPGHCVYRRTMHNNMHTYIYAIYPSHSDPLHVIVVVLRNMENCVFSLTASNSLHIQRMVLARLLLLILLSHSR